MCYEPDFELPETFLRLARDLEQSTHAERAELKLTPESAVLIQKIAEQTGLSVRGVTSALLSEGLAHFLMKGILF
jgi:hypothetical protein